MIFELVKKLQSAGSVLDKKYTKQNAVLTEEMLDKIGDRFQVTEKGDYKRRMHFCLLVFAIST
jgi:hypothetical protein